MGFHYPEEVKQEIMPPTRDKHRSGRPFVIDMRGLLVSWGAIFASECLNHKPCELLILALTPTWKVGTLEGEVVKFLFHSEGLSHSTSNVKLFVASPLTKDFP